MSMIMVHYDFIDAVCISLDSEGGVCEIAFEH